MECKPEEVNNLKGDAARCEFINKFKEVQRLKTQLEQYTEIEEKDAEKSRSCCRRIPCVRSVVLILMWHKD